MNQRRRTTVFLLIGAVLLFVVDRFSKYSALEWLHEPVILIRDILHLHFLPNTRFIFALQPSNVVIMSIVAIVMLVLMSLLAREYVAKNNAQVICLTVILIGAFSNLLDRFRFGYVIDFISIPFWSVFNLSDIYIVIGVIAFIWSMKKEEQHLAKNDSLR